MKLPSNYTPLPWRVDARYPNWPAIVGADGSHVNVDFENAADAYLIVQLVNARFGFPAEEMPEQLQEQEGEYVEWWGVPVRLP